MSNPRDKYGVDRAAERRGKPVVVDDMTFTVRSASSANVAYRYALSQAASPRREEMVNGGVRGMELLDEAQIEAFADAVVLGWEGVTNGDGHALAFTRENCVQLLTDCPVIWDAVRDAALDTSRFRPVVQEDGEHLGKS
jgi:hypothetical protein